MAAYCPFLSASFLSSVCLPLFVLSRLSLPLFPFSSVPAFRLFPVSFSPFYLPVLPHRNLSLRQRPVPLTAFCFRHPPKARLLLRPRQTGSGKVSEGIRLFSFRPFPLFLLFQSLFPAALRLLLHYLPLQPVHRLRKYRRLRGRPVHPGQTGHPMCPMHPLPVPTLPVAPAVRLRVSPVLPRHLPAHHFLSFRTEVPSDLHRYPPVPPPLPGSPVPLAPAVLPPLPGSPVPPPRQVSVPRTRHHCLRLIYHPDR